MKQIITISIIVAMVSLTLGCLIGASSGKISSGLNQLAKGDNSFQAGWDAAKQRLSETGFIPIGEDMEINFVSGEIQKIEDKKLYVKIQPLELLSDPELDNRILGIDENTKIYQMVNKDQDQFQKEMDEFQQKTEEQMNSPENMIEPITPPEPQSKQEVAFSEIKIGQQITAMAEGDIKEQKEFKATEIFIQFAPVSTDMSPVE